MTRCLGWRIGYIISSCLLLHISRAALAPPQNLLVHHIQQTSHDQLGAVASENRVCSQIGIDLLEAGGNAADAVSSQTHSPRAWLTIRTACWNHSLHWRGWLAIRPKRHDRRAERKPDCHHSGSGGGGFALVRSANGSYESIDFRETAPAAAFQDMFKNNVRGSVFGGLAR